MIEYGIQIASLCIMLTIAFNFFRHKRLPLRSTTFFACFIVFGIFNIIVEFGTLYTITHLDTVPSWLNRLVHQLFIGTIDIIIMMLFLYIDLKARKQQKYNKTQIIIRIIPVIITFFLIVFGDLKYYVGEDGYYSYGFMANTIYTFMVIYLILTLIIVFKNKRIFSNQEKLMIFLAIISWAVITIVQFFNPTWLLSSLAIVLMTQFLYMSFENSDRYLAINDGCVFTKSAFELTIKEYLEKNKAFYIVNISLTNNDTIINNIGIEGADDLFESFSNMISTKVHGTCFYSKERTISIIFDKNKDYKSFMSDKLDSVYEYKSISYKLSLHRKFVECNNNFKSFDEIIKALDSNIDHLQATRDNKTYNIYFKDIYYIEAVDNQTFLYTKDSFFEVKEKLYQLETILLDSFIRCSKSMICNTNKIVSLEKEKNSRLIATLSNEETIIVTRGYVKDVKSKVNM